MERKDYLCSQNEGKIFFRKRGNELGWKGAQEEPSSEAVL